MHLLRRKAVPLEPIPIQDSENRIKDVWQVRFTGEIFTDYNKYIEKVMLYKKPVWTCELTGKMNLTYEEALESERNCREKTKNSYPEVWIPLTLEMAQYKQGKLNDVVDKIYDYLKDNYIIGEIVYFKVPNTQQQKQGKIISISDKSKDEKIYRVHMVTKYGKDLREGDLGDKPIEYDVDFDSLRRDRCIFSKLLMRNFLRERTKRDTWLGAPIVVRHSVAKKYNISEEPPEDLKDLIEEKSKKRKRSRNAEEEDDDSSDDDESGSEVEEVSEEESEEEGDEEEEEEEEEKEDKKKSSKSKNNKSKNNKKGEKEKSKSKSKSKSKNKSKKIKKEEEKEKEEKDNKKKKVKEEEKEKEKEKEKEEEKKIEEINIKYPIEDLDLPKYIKEDLNMAKPNPMNDFGSISQNQVSSALMVWDFLNIYGKPLNLFPFTFDFFEKALSYTDEKPINFLIKEIYCSLLILILNNYKTLNNHNYDNFIRNQTNSTIYSIDSKYSEITMSYIKKLIIQEKREKVTILNSTEEKTEVTEGAVEKKPEEIVNKDNLVKEETIIEEGNPEEDKMDIDIKDNNESENVNEKNKNEDKNKNENSNENNNENINEDKDKNKNENNNEDKNENINEDKDKNKNENNNEVKSENIDEDKDKNSKVNGDVDNDVTMIDSENEGDADDEDEDDNDSDNNIEIIPEVEYQTQTNDPFIWEIFPNHYQAILSIIEKYPVEFGPWYKWSPGKITKKKSGRNYNLNIETIFELDTRLNGWEVVLLSCLIEYGCPSKIPEFETIISKLCCIDSINSNQNNNIPLNDIIKSGFLCLTPDEKIIILRFLIDELAINCVAIRDFIDHSFEVLTELRKQKIELSRERKELLRLKHEFNQGPKPEGSGDANATNPNATNTTTATKGADGVNDNNQGQVNSDKQGDDISIVNVIKNNEDNNSNSSITVTGIGTVASSVTKKVSYESDSYSQNSDANDYDSPAPFNPSRATLRQKMMMQRKMEREEQERKRREEYNHYREEALDHIRQNRKRNAEKRKLEDRERNLERKQQAIDVRWKGWSAMIRLKMLGRDRYYNRYWWYDSSWLGSNNSSSDRSSTKGFGANSSHVIPTWGTGKLFVENVHFEKKKNVTELEDDKFINPDAEWSYYSTPAELDVLLEWLNPKGIRESQLLKNIMKVLNDMASMMVKREQDLSNLLIKNENLENKRTTRSGNNNYQNQIASCYLGYFNRWMEI
jgi:hypothetical protein